MSHKAGDGKNLAYDEKLLDVAPQVTKGQRQEGYDADILNPTPPPATRSVGHGYSDNTADVESGASQREKHLAAGGYDPMESPAKKPFWKTPKGLIILAVIAVVIIAAAVGGGVGATAGKKNNNSLASNNSSSTATGGSSNTSDLPTKPDATSSATGCRGENCAPTTPTPTSSPSPAETISGRPTSTRSFGQEPGQTQSPASSSTPLRRFR